MKFFFAYRLPDQVNPTFIEGNAMRVADLKELPEDGFVFHSFLGEEIYVVQDYQVIDSSNFLCFITEESTQHICTKQEYEQMFGSFISDLQNDIFQKLILSRIKKIQTKKNALEIFHQLNENYPKSYNSIFSSAKTGTWLGASPELLLRSTGNNLKTVSLAGTKPADGISTWTSKEIREQALVSDFIIQTLKENNLKHIEVSEPYTIKAGSIEHIKTDISATVDNLSQVHTVLNSLHPTPATCGIPKDKALKKITETEIHHRKFYSGYIGIIKEGQAEFFVNLRCMEIFADFALLYVGGGITKESESEKEWLETEKKSETLGKFL